MTQLRIPQRIEHDTGTYDTTNGTWHMYVYHNEWNMTHVRITQRTEDDTITYTTTN